jgi:hypothetical protein
MRVRSTVGYPYLELPQNYTHVPVNSLSPSRSFIFVDTFPLRLLHRLHHLCKILRVSGLKTLQPPSAKRNQLYACCEANTNTPRADLYRMFHSHNHLVHSFANKSVFSI